MHTEIVISRTEIDSLRTKTRQNRRTPKQQQDDNYQQQADEKRQQALSKNWQPADAKSSAWCQILTTVCQKIAACGQKTTSGMSNGLRILGMLTLTDIDSMRMKTDSLRTKDENLGTRCQGWCNLLLNQGSGGPQTMPRRPKADRGVGSPMEGDIIRIDVYRRDDDDQRFRSSMSVDPSIRDLASALHGSTDAGDAWLRQTAEELWDEDRRLRLTAAAEGRFHSGRASISREVTRLAVEEATRRLQAVARPEG